MLLIRISENLRNQNSAPLTNDFSISTPPRFNHQLPCNSRILPPQQSTKPHTYQKKKEKKNAENKETQYPLNSTSTTRRRNNHLSPRNHRRDQTDLYHSSLERASLASPPQSLRRRAHHCAETKTPTFSRVCNRPRHESKKVKNRASGGRLHRESPAGSGSSSRTNASSPRRSRPQRGDFAQGPAYLRHAR